MDRQRRVVDRGPLHSQKGRAESFANYLRDTGLYESVEVVSSQAPTGEAISVETRGQATPIAAVPDPTLDELSKLFD
jgi:hypothetical protein